MNEQERFDRFLESYPHPHKNCFERPHLTRRQFFNLAGAGVTMGYLARPLSAGTAVRITSNPVTMQNKAKNCIFILMAGAPSHTDLFDLKYIHGVTPSSFAPALPNVINSPTGLL